MNSQFDGNVALGTGGASGIGEAIALQLALGGARVVVGDIIADAAADVVRRYAPGMDGRRVGA